MTERVWRSRPNLPSGDSPVQGLGERIVEQRTARGWKQRELAHRAGIDPGRLSRIERGVAVPKLEELMRLREALGGTFDELLLGTVQPGSLDELARDLDRLAARDEIAVLFRLLHLLVRGYQNEQNPSLRGDHE